MTPETNFSREQDNHLREKLAPIVALIILLTFVFFVIYMLRLTTVDDMAWTRAVYLFNGVEAIAFAAAGFFFGNEIQRKRAEKAEAIASEAEQRVVQSEKETVQEVSRARTLAEAIRAKAAARDSQIKVFGGLATKEAAGSFEPRDDAQNDALIAMNQADLSELADLVNRLYP